MKLAPKFRREPFNLHGTQSGFSLVELMIGLTLGLLAAIAIFASLTVFEKQRRTVSSGSDMQQNGLLAMYALEQDTRDAGYGLIDSSSMPGKLPCTIINAYLPGLARSGNPAVWTTSSGTSSTFNSSPVVISDGTGLNGSDTITLHRFDSDTGGIVTGGQAAKLAADATLQTGTMPTSISVDTEKPFHANDIILIADNGTCGLLQVASTATGLLNLGPTVYNSSGNPDVPAQPFTYSAASGTVINLGQLGYDSTTSKALPLCKPNDPVENPPKCSMPTFGSSLYEIISNDETNNNLALTSNGDTRNRNAVASNIVDIQAQYGVSNVGGQAVTCWTDASGVGCSLSDTTNDPVTGTPHDWSHPGHADVIRIKAIRVAIVARSVKKESSNVTTTVPTSWVDSTGLSTPPTLNLPGTYWQQYRYKVYQTIIPLRNVILGRLQ